MTQTFVERYMEDDVVYRIVGFVQDNIKFLLGFIITGIIAFMSGKIYGIRTQSVLFDLKEKYANIEQKKKTLHKQIQLLTWLQKKNKKIMWVIFIIELALIVNIIYHRGFDYTILLTNSLSRNLIFIFFLVVITLIVTTHLLRRSINSKKKYLLTIDLGRTEIGERLVDSLGPELTSILKLKLLTKSAHTKSIAIQTVTREQKEPVKNDFPEKAAIMQKMFELENVNVFLAKQLETHQANKSILKKDLYHYKKFLQQIQKFEWCENCLQSAGGRGWTECQSRAESVIVGEGEKKENELNSPEKTHPANQEKEKEKMPKFILEEDVSSKILNDTMITNKEPCTNNCLKKYFELGYKISEEFNKEEDEIVQLRQRLSSMDLFNNQK